MQQAVDTAEIDEGAVFGDVLDHAVDDLALMEVADHLGALFGAAFFKDGAARHHDVAAATVHLEDLERLLQPHQRAGVTHRADIDLAAGQEGHRTAKIDGKAALDAAEDGAIDALFLGIGFFKPVPGGLAAGLLAADRGFAAGVLDPVEIDLDDIADGDLGVLAGACEFLQIDPAFHLVADIDDGLARLDGDDPALDDSSLFRGVDLEAFLQKRFEFVHCCFGAHAYRVPFLVLFLAVRLAPPVFRLVRHR